MVGFGQNIQRPIWGLGQKLTKFQPKLGDGTCLMGVSQNRLGTVVWLALKGNQGDIPPLRAWLTSACTQLLETSTGRNSPLVISDAFGVLILPGFTECGPFFWPHLGCVVCVCVFLRLPYGFFDLGLVNQRKETLSGGPKGTQFWPKSAGCLLRQEPMACKRRKLDGQVAPEVGSRKWEGDEKA